MSIHHRHLDYDEDVPLAERGPAAIDDVLERGTIEDWVPLLRVIGDDPHGPLAATVLRLLEANPRYGTGPLLRTWIVRRRGQAPR